MTEAQVHVKISKIKNFDENRALDEQLSSMLRYLPRSCQPVSIAGDMAWVSGEGEVNLYYPHVFVSKKGGADHMKPLLEHYLKLPEDERPTISINAKRKPRNATEEILNGHGYTLKYSQDDISNMGPVNKTLASLGLKRYGTIVNPLDN